MPIYVRTTTLARNIFHPIITIMATIGYRLSMKIQQDGKAEIMMRFFHRLYIPNRSATNSHVFHGPNL